jgi:myo-inositol-1(or 4)-monophosphatase
MKENINQIKKVAILAAKKAGEFLAQEFKNFDRTKVKFKSRHEIVSLADIGAEKIILNLIKKNFPDHSILSEESGKNRQKSDYLWIVDPLDGSTNFSYHNPFFAVSIGLVYQSKIILGIIYAPTLKELYLAECNKPSLLNGKKIKVSSIFQITKSLNAFCHSSKEKDIRRAVKYYQKQKIQGFDCRQVGSASLELAYVAAGRIESIAIPGAHPWDVAAGVLLVRNAGGKVTDFSGRQWLLPSYDLVASNARIHRELIRVLRKI